MMKIEDFMGDFTDGVQFCNLLEVISSKKLPKWNAKPRIKAQKLENVSFGLQFLKKEGIKLVAIGPEDVVEPKLKLILGLIWTIILRYQIQRGEDDGGSARSELLKWVRSKIPEYDIKNFDKDWRSGKAICALAEAVEPGQMKLPQDFKNDPLTDATMGMKKAEDNMGIPMVLYPEDMVSDADELSNMTYISYFRDYEEKRGQRDLDDKLRRTPVAEQCRAYGPGLEGGEALIPGDFIIEARNAKGELIPMGGFPFSATCEDPKGNPVGVTLKDNGDGTLNATYTPSTDGVHIVTVKLGELHIGGVGSAKSPFRVPIKAAQADPSRTKIFGPGVEGGFVGTVAAFTVQAFNRFGTPIPHGGAPFHLTVTGPSEGADPRRQGIKDKGDGSYAGEYLPILHGFHTVLVELQGKPVAQCPIRVPIERDPNAADPTKSWAEHLNEPTTIEPVKLRIHAVRPDGKPMTKGGDNFDVEVVDPHGDIVPATIKDNGDGTYDVEIDAQEAGPHKTDLFLRNKEIPTHIEHIKDFPKVINVDPGVDAKKTLVQGPGVEPTGVLQDQETHFDIITKDSKGRDVGNKGAGQPFQVSIRGPRGNVPARVVDKKDGTYHVTYTPTDHGDTRIEVTLKNEPVAQSPYNIFVKPAVSAARTTCSGPALQPGNKDGVPTHFVIETKDKEGKPCGKHGADQPFITKVTGPTGPVEVKQVDNGDGTVRVDFTPRDHGAHTIEVTLQDQQVDRSPYKIVVDPTIDASRSAAYGPGIENNKNRDGEPTNFTVELRDKDGKPIGSKAAGVPLVATVNGPTGPVPVKQKDNRDGTYNFEYTPLDHGDHTIDIKLDDKDVAEAPYHIRVLPSTSAKGTVCEGPGLHDGIIETYPTHFDIICNDNKGRRIGAEAAGQPFEVTVTGPTGKVPSPVKDNGDGSYHVEYTPIDSGSHVIEVKLGRNQVAESPYRVRVDGRVSTKQTKCFGPGLSKDGVTELYPTKFTIETRDKNGRLLGKLGANQPFKVDIEGPTGPVANEIVDNGDGTYTVNYTPAHSGPNTINVTLGDEGHVAESPYHINVQPKIDPKQTKVWGPGLEDGILDTQPQEFYVQPLDQDGKPLGPAGKGKPIKVTVEGPKGPVPVKQTEDPETGKRTVVYEPNCPGNYHIEVTFEDEHVANSPYDVRIDAGAYAKNTLIESYSFVVRTKTRENENKPVGGESKNFSVTIEGPGAPVPELEDLNDGAYRVSYSLPNRGRYTINVKLNNEHIQGSPFTQSN